MTDDNDPFLNFIFSGCSFVAIDVGLSLVAKGGDIQHITEMDIVFEILYYLASFFLVITSTFMLFSAGLPTRHDSGKESTAMPSNICVYFFTCIYSIFRLTISDPMSSPLHVLPFSIYFGLFTLSFLILSDKFVVWSLEKVETFVIKLKARKAAQVEHC